MACYSVHQHQDHLLLMFLVFRQVQKIETGIVILSHPIYFQGNLLFISGQLPWREGKLQHPGRVGDDVNLENAQEAAKLV
jgi:hypothetical protein